MVEILENKTSVVQNEILVSAYDLMNRALWAVGREQSEFMETKKSFEKLINCFKTDYGKENDFFLKERMYRIKNIDVTKLMLTSLEEDLPMLK